MQNPQSHAGRRARDQVLRALHQPNVFFGGAEFQPVLLRGSNGRLGAADEELAHGLEREGLAVRWRRWRGALRTLRRELECFRCEIVLQFDRLGRFGRSDRFLQRDTVGTPNDLARPILRPITFR